MNDNIRLLEDRVAEAAKRMQGLSEERARLRREVEDLRARAVAPGTSAATAASAGSKGEAILAERAGLAARLREALELLGDE